MSTAVYPVTTKTLYLAETMIKEKPELQVDTAVIPNAYAAVCKPSQEMKVCHHLAELPQETDTVIFLSFWDREKMIKQIREMIRAGKNVICTFQLSDDEKTEVCELADHYGVKALLFENKELLEKLEYRADPYTPQDSIVVAVGALTKGISTSETLVELRAALKDSGYKVSVIASDPNLRILGYDYLSIPDLIGKNLDYAIITINRYLNYHQYVNHADIILLQLPDEGLHRTTIDIETCFGPLTYLVSQAVSIDYGIMLSPILDSDAATYQALSDIAKQRFGFAYDAVGILPQEIDSGSSQGMDGLNYSRMPKNDADEIIRIVKETSEEEGGDILLEAEWKEWIPKAVQNMIDKLS